MVARCKKHRSAAMTSDWSDQGTLYEKDSRREAARIRREEEDKWMADNIRSAETSGAASNAEPYTG